MNWRLGSLRARLTIYLVLVQAIALVAFIFAASIPMTNLMSSEQGLDDSVIQSFAESVQRRGPRQLDLVPSEDLIRLTAEHPVMWFYAADANGTSVQLGDIPEWMAPLIAGLTRLHSADIGDMDVPGQPATIVRRHDSPAGLLWVATAGGPDTPLRAVFAAAGGPMYLQLLALLTAVSFLVIPLIVRLQFRGVNKAAAEAEQIDIAQRGMRLSFQHVPDELHSLVRAVNAALQRLDDGIERRQRFLADAAHELRTPVAILQTRIELLPHDEQRSRLMLDVARLANLANQLLDLERFDADLTILQPVDLVDLAAQVTADMAPLAIAAGDEISFDAEVESVTVAADAASLSRALINLIQNAVIHGGRKTNIRVAVCRKGSLTVADTGSGIAVENREAIFEPFCRVVPLDQGAGLGLNLVKDIVLRHKGKITVGDAPGGGALFEISLPVIPTQAAQSA
jgi:signal transduction histidine kinase